jgi:hypothetical protein
MLDDRRFEARHQERPRALATLGLHLCRGRSPREGGSATNCDASFAIRLQSEASARKVGCIQPYASVRSSSSTRR